MIVTVLLNAAAGSKDAAAVDRQIRQVRQAFGAVDVRAEVQAVKADRLAEAAKQAAAQADGVVAAGGDGTVSAVAGALVGTDKPMGVLPLGTLNHFAKDMGIPQALPQAAAVIATGAHRAIDIAEVNGRTFINNSSIGLYPRIVGQREQQRQRLGRGKWPAMLSAAMSVFRRLPTLRLRLHAAGRMMEFSAPFLFVGNNAYQFNLFSLGSRAGLDGGVLSLYFPTRGGRFALLGMTGSALLGRLQQREDFVVMNEPEARVESPQRLLHVSLDGEITRLAPPLHYRIRPKALRVWLPGRGGSV